MFWFYSELFEPVFALVVNFEYLLGMSVMGDTQPRSAADLWYHVEPETKVREDYTNTQKALTRTRAFSWLKAATSTFTFKTPFRHYAKQMPKHGK